MPDWLKSIWDNLKVVLIIMVVFLIVYITGPHFGWLDYLGLDAEDNFEGNENKLSILMMAYYIIISIGVILIISIPIYMFKRLKGKIAEYRYRKNKKRMWIKAQQSPLDMFSYKARYGEYENE